MDNKNGKQMRFTDEELRLIRDTFKDNLPLLKALRKVFLPEYDPKAPLGQVVDLWQSVPIENLSPEAAWINMKARNDLIKHVESNLLQLQGLAGIVTETPEEIKKRMTKNSAR